MELGATPNVASTWMFLAKVGVPIQTIAYFMNQPIVRDYLGSLENSGYSWLFIDSLMDGTMDKYAPQGDVVATELPTETALGKMVGVDVDNLTDPQKAQQQLVLQEFLKYAKMANHLFQVTQGTNYDTATLNDPSLIFKKGKQLESARRTILSSINDEGNVIPGVDAILNSSFVGYLKETMTDIRDAFAEILTSDKPAVRDVIEEALTPFVQLNDRDFVKLARKTVNDLFDWAVQTDTGVNRRITSILLGNDTTDSAATLIMEYKKMVLADKEHPLFDNLIINSIQKKPGRKEEGAPDNIFLVGKDAKVYNQNQIIYAFRELKRNVPTELYGKLVRLAVLQSVLNNSPISITSLLPYEDFTAVYNETLSKIDKMPNLNNFNKLNVLQRNNWADTDVVPSKKAAWKKSKKGNWFSRPYSPSEINFVDKRLALATQKGLIPQTLNISTLSREGNSKFITFVWEKGNFTKEQKATMRKKSDFSYINKGLFKRVEDGFGNPIQLTTEDKDGKTYTSYVYKAINAWGDSFRANELYDTEDPANPFVTTGQKSVLDNGYIQVKEVEDSAILNLLPEIDPMTFGLTKDSFEDYSIQPAIDGSNKINIYAGTGENAELSNFAKRPFKDELDPPFSDVNKFYSVEQAFQFYKVYYTVPKYHMFKCGDVTRNNYAIAKQILRTTDGATLRRLGKSFENFDSSEWDNDASNVMYSFIKKSFEQNPEALQKLLATGNAELTHTYKGIEQDKGRFSKVLMGVRSELSATKDINKIAPEGLPEIDNNNKNNCG
jgi:predicted NAD-dependent protein-ADP-ribosyltransferase YbiA (DUF1768 family)